MQAKYQGVRFQLQNASVKRIEGIDIIARKLPGQGHLLREAQEPDVCSVLCRPQERGTASRSIGPRPWGYNPVQLEIVAGKETERRFFRFV